MRSPGEAVHNFKRGRLFEVSYSYLPSELGLQSAESNSKYMRLISAFRQSLPSVYRRAYIGVNSLGVQTMKSVMVDNMKKRFEGLMDEPLYVIATCVDPRYRMHLFDAEKPCFLFSPRQSRNSVRSLTSPVQQPNASDWSTRRSQKWTTSWTSYWARRWSHHHRRKRQSLTSLASRSVSS